MPAIERDRTAQKQAQSIVIFSFVGNSADSLSQFRNGNSLRIFVSGELAQQVRVSNDAHQYILLSHHR